MIAIEGDDKTSAAVAGGLETSSCLRVESPTTWYLRKFHLAAARPMFLRERTGVTHQIFLQPRGQTQHERCDIQCAPNPNPKTGRHIHKTQQYFRKGTMECVTLWPCHLHFLKYLKAKEETQIFHHAKI
jgi:hypothetical protein